MSSLSPAELRVLATMGLIVERNGMDHTRIGGMERPGRSGVSAGLLARDWGIYTAEDALERIEWLRTRGFRSELERAHERERLLGWDLLRAIAVASWAHHAYLLELDVAWRHMVEISRELQQAYRSWRELGQSYLLGYEIQLRRLALGALRTSRGEHSGREVGTEQELAILRDGTLPRLLSRQDSPWLALPYDLDLADRPPTLTPNELRVAPDGGGDGKTIGHVLALARPGDRVVLSPGVYRERVDIRTPIELVARGDVTIEGNDSCCLFVNTSSVVASGVRFAAKMSSKNEPMHAVIVHSHFARLVGCDVSAPRFGVYLATEKARVDIVRSTVHDAQIAVFADGGQLVVEDSSLLASAAANVQCGGETHARLVRGRIAESRQAGVCVRKGASVELRGVTLEDNEFGIDVLDGGTARAEGGRIALHRSGGARAFGPESRLWLEGITLSDNGAVNLGAVGATDVVAQECTMEGAGAAAWADQGGRIVLRRCRVGLGTEGLTREMNEGRVVLEDCDAAATHEA